MLISPSFESYINDLNPPSKVIGSLKTPKLRYLICEFITEFKTFGQKYYMNRPVT